MKKLLLLIFFLGTLSSSLSQLVEYSEVYKAVFDGDRFIEKLLDRGFVLVNHEEYKEGLSGAYLVSLALKDGYNPKDESASVFIYILGKTLLLNYRIHIMVTESHKDIFDDLKASIIQDCEKTDFYFNEKSLYGEKGRFVSVYRKENRRFLSEGIQFNLYKEVNSSNVTIYCIDAECYYVND